MRDTAFINQWTDRSGGSAEEYQVPVVDRLDDTVVPCPDQSAFESSAGSSGSDESSESI